MTKTADGQWSADGSHFIYDYEKIAKETGYTVDEVRMRGVSYCRRNVQKEQRQ